jgi:2-haloacid dehalogenase
MTIQRREFLGVVAPALLAGTSLLSWSTSGAAKKPSSWKVVAFDAFPIFDPRPVFALAEQLFPQKGGELNNLWRTRQFEYQWLRSITGHYADFRQATEDALVYATKQLKLDLTAEKRAQLIGSYERLHAWPDVSSALLALKNAGLRLAFLSNMTRGMLDANITNSGLGGIFEQVLSTDDKKLYKPDPRAYQMAIDAFGVKREEILFVAFAGWDAAGAKSFGYPTFWVNRLDLPAEELGAIPDATGAGLKDLVSFVTNRN